MNTIYWVIIGLVVVGLAVLLVKKGCCKGLKKKNGAPVPTSSDTESSE
ncbi:hypothetical protein KJ562_00105 [Patescibacteria group bacterium]|nr:hypothetical protein [Patescibacteria group bacterium]